MIGEGSNMLTADGWKNLPAAIKAHIQAGVFAESIDSRGDAEGFFAHKARFSAEYFKQNPALCLMVLATMTNTGRLARNEWNRLAEIEKAHTGCTPNAEGEQAKKDLVKANTDLATANTDLATAKANLEAATKERDVLKGKLATAQQEVTAANEKHATFASKHIDCKTAAELSAAQERVTALTQELEAANAKLEDLRPREAAVVVLEDDVTDVLLEGLKEDARKGKLLRSSTPAPKPS